MPCKYFICSNSIFHFLVPRNSYVWVAFLPLFATPPSRFRPHTKTADETTAALNSCHTNSPSTVPSGSFGTVTKRCPQRCLLRPCLTSLQLYPRGPHRPERSCRTIGPGGCLWCKLHTCVDNSNSRYSALEFGPYACITHRKRSNSFNLKVHTLLVRSIHQHSLPAECFQVSPP